MEDNPEPGRQQTSHCALTKMQKKILDKQKAEQFHNDPVSLGIQQLNLLMRKYLVHHYPQHYRLSGPDKELEIISDRVSDFFSSKGISDPSSASP